MGNGKELEAKDVTYVHVVNNPLLTMEYMDNGKAFEAKDVTYVHVVNNPLLSM